MIGRFTATGVVIASMVGTGVFIGLGYQVATIKSTFAILLLWLMGGVYALCGAVCYAELAARLPRSGGEYHFLSRIYHPALGFLAGWVSVIVGFAAPAAVAAIVVGKYASYWGSTVSETWIAVAVILLCGCIHFGKAGMGRFFQNGFTMIKMVLLVGFAVICLLMVADPQPVNFLPGKSDFKTVFSMDFATAFVWVTFSYSGWNAAVYVSGEVHNANRSVPYALLIGTFIVCGIYLLLNYVFLQSIPFSEIEKLNFAHSEQKPEPYEIAALAAEKLYSGYGQHIAKALISIGLVATIGAYVFIGPRISQAIGEDFKTLRFLSRKNRNGIPLTAIVCQLSLSILFVLSGDLKSIVMYVEFSLIIFSVLSIVGLFVLRFQEQNIFGGYKAWGFPWTGLFFLLMSGWVLVSVFASSPWPSMAAIVTILLGLIIYYATNPSRDEVKK
tara:strand:+ start:206 stop:1534 length:1329 start_codon:yes stop_codon:yes gene_type:complete